MKKANLIFALVVVSLALSACAKKDSEFAARYAKNKAGALVVDGKKTQEAAEYAAALGLEADIVAVQKYFSNMDTEYGPYLVMAKILINNKEIPVTMSHIGTKIVEGQTTVDGHVVVFHSICSNAACSPYYAAMEVYKNGERLIQVGLRKYFNPTAQQKDLYEFFKPADALPLMGTTLDDTRGMVGYLNANSGAATANSSGFIQ